jgi:hypothetical protein
VSLVGRVVGGSSLTAEHGDGTRAARSCAARKLGITSADGQ